MGTAGIALSGQVIDLLEHPLRFEPAKQGSIELCEVAEQLAAAHRAVDVAELRQLDEMVAREGSAKAIGITAAWLCERSELLLPDALATVKLAVRLCAHPRVLAQYAAGEISRREAQFIVNFLAHPPKGMPAEAAGEVRDFLLQAAQERKFDRLRAEGDKVREIFSDAPTPGEDIDRNTFQISRLSHGRYDLAGNVDTETGETLLAALAPYSVPRPDHEGNPDPRTAGQRFAEALGELARRNDPDLKGADGKALPPRLSVTIPIQDLFADVPDKAALERMIREGRFAEALEKSPMASTEWGNWISHATARRLACDCELAVIGVDANGAPLNVNTGKRFASRKQRRALAMRDCGCAFPGCNRPASWTQAHHIVQWKDTRETTIDNLVALCHYHHIAVHHHGWEVAMGANRFPVFKPPRGRQWRDSNCRHVEAPPGFRDDLPSAA